MTIGEEVARARRLSNDALLASLTDILGNSRRLTGLLIAHLGEMEERRIHLLAGYTSMFEYCTARLGMSEDEACRRIEVARLARHFPLLYERLASGSISLSVVALLKHRLTDANQAGLLDAVSGKTVARAREVLAAWFPQPDVPPSIRKLPERRSASGPTAQSIAAGPLFAFSESATSKLDDIGPANSPGSICFGNTASGNVGPANAASNIGFGNSVSDGAAPAAEARGAATSPPTAPAIPTALLNATLVPEGSLRAPAMQAQRLPPPRGARPSSNIAALSPGRFKVTFTADAALKQKLDLARDLLRHAVPSGDLATIVARALDLLIQKTEKRRFAKTSQSRSSQPKANADKHLTKGADAKAIPAAAPSATIIGTESHASPSLASCAATDQPAPAAPLPAAPLPEPLSAPQPPAASLPEPLSAAPLFAPQPPAAPLPTPPSAPPPASRSRYLPAAVRRAVHERDGTRCTWQAPDGTRCNSRAWLEHDHIIPRGQGGTNDPANIHPYCRAHNRLAAEQTYGKATIARIIARHRATRDNADERQPPP